MWCNPPSIPSADIIQPAPSDRLTPFSTEDNEKKQLSFIYQPGIGLYDKKKIEIDQDLRITSSTADVDERIQSLELSPTPSTFTSDVDHRWSSSSSLESSSPTSKPNNLYKSYLRRQNEQDSLPIRQTLFSSDDILANKNTTSPPSDKSYHHIKLLDIDRSTNQENNHKRKFDQHLLSNKKLRRSPTFTTKYHPWTNEQKPADIVLKPTASDPVETSKCEKNLLDEELNRQKAKLAVVEEQKRKKPSVLIKLRSNSNEPVAKQSLTTIIKNIPLVRKLSSENQKPPLISPNQEVLLTPSQGLLLCPKDELMKKKKKKKIASIITASTELLDDDSVLDSILFNEMQSVQQQWQQFLTFTMEKELHINPSDGKRKLKLNKFQRTNDFLLAYENLYNFEGMKHWYPTPR